MSSDNEDEYSYDLFSRYPGIKRITELASEMLEYIATDTESAFNSFKVMEKRLTEAIRPLYEFSLPAAKENLGKIFKTFADGALLYRLQSLGILEWCNIDAWIKMDSKDLKEGSVIPFSDWVLLRLEREESFTIDKVDKYIGSRFSKDILKKIEEETTLSLSESDSLKLRKAMIDFRARRYFESANMLASLIDSQSIKQELFDVQNGKYQDRFKKNISQGWKSFYHVFANNFAIHFGGEEFTGEVREETFEKFIEKIKGKIPYNESGKPNIDDVVSIIALSICLFNFFSISKWVDYPDNKPTVINRHWLMHGMYDLEDITRYDCIKLLLILNQISKLYAKLKNGEI